jgi:hypothetical protein
MKLRVILTGATGMVGEGVLHECLQHKDVEQVLVINRKPCGVTHPRLKEIIHKDFYDLHSVQDQLTGYNACFFCLGVSSVGMKEEEYNRKTYVLTLHFAEILSKMNHEMVFCYISGAGTDSSEKGRSMWARVKGRTENDLMKLPFKKVYAFRPGLLKPTPGLKNTLGLYKYLGWLYPVLHKLAPGSGCTLAELGLAMINAASKGYEKSIIEVRDMLALSLK